MYEPCPPPSELPEEDVHIFSMTVDASEEEAQALERVLASDERARAARFHFARDRVRFTLGRAYLRTILARYVDAEPAHVSFRYGTKGKPALSMGSASERLRFNMSGSHGVAVLAIQADDEVGIDVEQVRALTDALPIAERFFSPEEHRGLLELPPESQHEGFFRCWTRKEAIVKSIGLGLSQPLDSFTVPTGRDEAPTRVVFASRGESVLRWLVPVPSPAVGYLAALATAGAPRPLRCWKWSGY